MTIVLFLELFAGENSLLGVDNDYVIATVNVRSELGLTLTAEKIGNHSCSSSEGLTGGVDYIPLALNLSGFCHKSGHNFLPPKILF